MKLKGRLFCVLGGHGFIGSSLKNEILKRGGEVTSTPTKDCEAVFHFASYTHIPFEKNPSYHTQEVLNSYMYLLAFCEQYEIPFIYPSSALVYEKERSFYHFKKATEELCQIYNVRTLGLRIFPVYGQGEGERGHPTAIAQWILQMIQGKRPVVYGDGTQSRGFIYISDVVDNILKFTFDGSMGVKDIGVGEKYVFNDIIKIINEELGTDLKPKYMPLPKGYTEGIVPKEPITPKVSIRQGIKDIISEIGSYDAL